MKKEKIMKLFRLAVIALICLAGSAWALPALVQGTASASTSIVPSYSASYSRNVSADDCLIMPIATQQGEIGNGVQDITSGANLASIYGSPRPIGSWYVNIYYEKVQSSEVGKKPLINIPSIPGWGDVVMFLNEYSGVASCNPSVAPLDGGSVTNGLFSSGPLTTISGNLGVGFIVFTTGNVRTLTSTGTSTHLEAQIQPSWGSAGFGDAITPTGNFYFSGSLSVSNNQYGFAMAVFH